MAVTSVEAVYVLGQCDVIAYDPATGSTLWNTYFGCNTAFDTAVALYRDRVYASAGLDAVYVFDAATGRQLQVYAGRSIPAFAGTRAFMLAGGHLQAFDVTTGTPLWNFAGGGDLTSAPLVGA